MDQTLDSNNSGSEAVEHTAVETHQHNHVGHVHGPGCSHHHHSHDPVVRAEAKVGRNDPCPCGSQQKFKKCHGK